MVDSITELRRTGPRSDSYKNVSKMELKLMVRLETESRKRCEGYELRNGELLITQVLI